MSKVDVKPLEYYSEIIRIIKDDLVLRKLYDFYMSRDISQFKPTIRPKTSFTSELKAVSRSLELQFIIDFVEKIPDSQEPSENSLECLFSLFTAFLNTNFTGTKYGTSTQKFILKLKKYDIDGFERIRKENSNVWSCDKLRMTQWFYKKGFLDHLDDSENKIKYLSCGKNTDLKRKMVRKKERRMKKQEMRNVSWFKRQSC